MPLDCSVFCDNRFSWKNVYANSLGTVGFVDSENNHSPVTGGMKFDLLAKPSTKALRSKARKSSGWSMNVCFLTTNGR